MANPYFNAAYYLTNNPDVFAAGINTTEAAWDHYVTYGAAEALSGSVSRQPAPWFDVTYYLQTYSDLATSGMNAGELFDHFTNYGIAEGRQPSQEAVLTEANLLAYAKGNADLLEAFGIEADATELTVEEEAALASHFYQFGYKEDRANSPFDADPEPSNEGLTFTLTTNADTLSPNSAVASMKTTAGDDLVRGVIDNSLQTADSIDGGAGNDTVKANLTANASAAAVATVVRPVLKNIENVFLNATVTGGDDAANTASVTFNAADTEGLQNLWSEGSTLTAGSASATLTFEAVKLSTVVGLKDSAGALTVNFAGVNGAADEANLALADATGNVTIAGVETLNVDSTTGSLSGTAVNTSTLSLAQAESVVITGDQAANLTLTASNLKTVNASGFEKALTLNFTPAANKPVSIEGGAGADTFNLAATNGAKVTIDAGAGNDTVNLNADAFHVVTIGDGSDTINLNTYTSAKAIVIDTAATLGASAIEITDFTSGADVLRLDVVSNAAGGNKVAVSGTQLANIAAQTNLLLATQEAAKLAAADGDVVAFQYGTDSYVFINESGADATLGTTDVLVKLAGVTSLASADIAVI